MGFTESMNEFSQTIANFFTIPIRRLSHFNALKKEEKIGYGVLLGGLVFLLISLVLFII